MNFTVRWSRKAKQALAQLWTSATDRAGITAAANYIEVLLQRDPRSQGESRTGNTRILFVPPLAVLYRINEQKRKVRIIRVRLFPGSS
jgi:plasmid stabilization system protein ParE